VPIRIASGEPGCVAPAHTRLPAMASPPDKLRGMIEIEVSGAREIGAVLAGDARNQRNAPLRIDFRHYLVQPLVVAEPW
jgi:hypothetical protein